MQLAVQYTNTVKVLDCLEYTFNRITIANGWLTDGVVVDRKRDPRIIFQNKDDQYRKLGALIRMKVGDWKKVAGNRPGGGPIGNTRRKKQIIELICGQSLTPEQSQAGIDVEMIKDWLRHDIEWSLRDDMQLINAATAVSAAKAAEGIFWGTAPEVINASLDEGMAGSINAFPEVYQTLIFSYEYDETAPLGAAGLDI
jgi:hypothetical protein